MKSEEDIRKQIQTTQQIINAYQNAKSFQSQMNCAFQEGVHSGLRWVLGEYDKGGKS